MAELEPTGRLRVPFQGERAATGPLTFGQRDTFNWVSTGEDQFSALLFWRLRLPDGVRFADIAAALGVLLARHESLRTNFVSGPLQRVSACGELWVDLLRVPDELRSAPLAEIENMLVDGMRAKGIDIATDLPIRAAIATVDGVPTAGALLCSHMAADLGSMAVLGTQFSELVAMSMAGTPLPDREPLGYQPLDQAEFERSATSLRRNANAVRYWGEHLRTSPGAMYPMPAPEAPVAGHLSGFLHSTAGGRALTRIVERVGTGRQIVLLAAVCTVLSVRTGVDRCVFALMSGNRFRERLHDYVGTLAQDSLLAFDVGGDDFDDVVRRVVAATVAANTHSRYDIDHLSQVMDEIGHARGIAFNRDFSFNNLSDFMALESPPGQSPQDTPSAISWLAWEHFPEMLMCHPVCLGPELVFALTADLRHVERSDLEVLLHGVERLLVAAADGVVPLDKLPEITGVEPIRRGADWVCVDSCWVRLSAVRRLVTETLDVPAYVDVDEHGLVAYLPAVVDSPEAVHSACVTALPQRFNTMAPGRYVLCAGTPENLTDSAAWKALPVVAAGSGRGTAIHT